MDVEIRFFKWRNWFTHPHTHTCTQHATDTHSYMPAYTHAHTHTHTHTHIWDGLYTLSLRKKNGDCVCVSAFMCICLTENNYLTLGTYFYTFHIYIIPFFETSATLKILAVTYLSSPASCFFVQKLPKLNRQNNKDNADINRLRGHNPGGTDRLIKTTQI